MKKYILILIVFTSLNTLVAQAACNDNHYEGELSCNSNGIEYKWTCVPATATSSSGPDIYWHYYKDADAGRDFWGNI